MELRDLSNTYANGVQALWRRHRLSAGQQTVTVTVDGPPARAGVDPYHGLIDRTIGDNTVAVE